jgi:hypothetical protein
VSFAKKTGSTAGRVVYNRWRWRFEIEYVSDLISADYMRRWQLRVPQGALRLHHILRGDMDRDCHDHPMDFTSLVLSGGYIEHTPDKEPRKFLPGDVNRKRAEDLHRLELIGDDAWTIVLAGPFRRDWGFETEDGWVVAGDYDAYKVKKYGVNTIGEVACDVEGCGRAGQLAQLADRRAIRCDYHREPVLPPLSPAHTVLQTLSPEELGKYQPASEEEIAHAFRVGQLEARMFNPAAGENMEALEHEHAELLRSAPMKRGGSR